MIAKRSIDKQEECLGVLVECNGKERDIASLTLGDASEFESFGKKRGFSDAHQRTHNRYAKLLFAYATDHGWVEANPFRKLKSTSLAATARHYVTPEDTVSLLKACPGLQWKLLIGLARYAGLRVPSEAFAITWDMVGWDKKALCIPSKKTRRYAESRVCPILAELMELLNRGWDFAAEKATTILTLSVANVRRKLPAIIKDAKLQPWKELFKTLRRSCETHFVSLGHPAHAVSNWLGHSSQVSKDYYLMITSDAFQNATEKKTDLQDRPTHPLKDGSIIPGAESGAVNCGKRRKPTEMGAESGAVENENSDPLNEKTQVNPGNSLVVRGGLEPPTHGFSDGLESRRKSLFPWRLLYYLPRKQSTLMLQFSAKIAGLSSNYRIQNGNYRIAFFVVREWSFRPPSRFALDCYCKRVTYCRVVRITCRLVRQDN